MRYAPLQPPSQSGVSTEIHGIDQRNGAFGGGRHGPDFPPGQGVSGHNQDDPRPLEIRLVEPRAQFGGGCCALGVAPMGVILVGKHSAKRTLVGLGGQREIAGHQIIHASGDPLDVLAEAGAPARQAASRRAAASSAAICPTIWPIQI